MNSAQRIRCFMLVAVILVMVGVFVFCKQEPQLATAAGQSQEFEAKPLALRKNMSLSIDEQPSGANQQFVPIPDRAVPIQWEEVQQRRAPIAARAMRAPPNVEGDRLEDRNQDFSAARTAKDTPQPQQPQVRYHRIVDGETLRDISGRYLGSPDRFMEIFFANRAILPHPDVLPLGAKISIPPRNATVATQPSPQFSPLPSMAQPPTEPQEDGFRSMRLPEREIENPWRSRANGP